MKINMKEELRKVVIKEYVACDGKVFATEQACRKHEEIMTDSIKVKYDAIPRIEDFAEDCMLPTWYSSGEKVHIIRIRDEQDVETLTKWVGRYSGDTRKLTTADIGRVVMLVYDEYCDYAKSDYCDVLFYEEDVLKRVQEFWQNISKAEI